MLLLYLAQKTLEMGGQVAPPLDGATTRESRRKVGNTHEEASMSKEGVLRKLKAGMQLQLWAGRKAGGQECGRSAGPGTCSL